MPDAALHDRPELLLFHFGPVQDFIEQARSCRDLWSGSYFLSWLTAHALKAVTDEAGEDAIVFPCLRGNGIFAALNRNHAGRKAEMHNAADGMLTPTLPNRFLAAVPSGRGRELAERAERALRAELNAIAGAVWRWLAENGAKTAWKARFDAQVAAFPETAWAVLPAGANPGSPAPAWPERFGQIASRLAARRNTRDFKQWQSVGDAVVKDSLSGREECIGDRVFWEKLARDHGDLFTAKSHRYGAMNLIKRLWCRDDRVPYLREKLGLREGAYRNAMRYDDTAEIAGKNTAGAKTGSRSNYIAVLAMDGDQMGTWLSDMRAPAEHARFSGALADFATRHARATVEKHDGELLYAGGDDVLAILPATKVIECALDLREAFKAVFSKERIHPELSGGIAVGHYTAPLQMLVAEAHGAEVRAKNGYGRAALAVNVYKRSGEILHWGCKWDSPAPELLRRAAAHSLEEKLSGRFPYALAELLAPYRLDAPEKPAVPAGVLKDIILKDFDQAVERQGRELGGEEEAAFRDLAVRYLENLPGDRLADFGNLFLVETFINRREEA